MQLFSKTLTQTDVNDRLAFPNGYLNHLPAFEDGNNYVDFRVKDSSQEVRVFRCRLRNEGRYLKPEVATGWRKYVRDYDLNIGDKIVFFQEDDDVLGAQYRIEAKRMIKLFGKEIWDDVFKP